MLTIENFRNIEGKEFQLNNGTKYIIGIARGYHDKYSFAVFQLDDTGIANIHNSIVFHLSKQFEDNGVTYGYPIYNPKMTRIKRVLPQNLTLNNFVLELHIQTADVVNNR